MMVENEQAKAEQEAHEAWQEQQRLRQGDIALDFAAEEKKKQRADEDAAAEEARLSAAKANEKLSLNPQHKGTQVKLINVAMTGTALLKASALRLQVACLRCRDTIDAGFSPPAVAGMARDVTHHQKCPSCSLSITIRYRPGISHRLT
jgi:hypothetical protein